jgi:hypothetical protein
MKHVCFFLFLCMLAGTAAAQIHFTASLDGAQAGTASTGTGTGSFSLSDDFTELKYIITYQGLTGPLSVAGGHFHVGAPGIAGPVVKPLLAGGGPAAQTFSGTWRSTEGSSPLTPALVESLLAGRIYVNLHTAANPAGEIRGRLELATPLHFVMNLDGAQAGSASTGSGTGVLVLYPSRDSARYYISYRGLTGNLSGAGGHFHTGSPGVNGPVVRAVASGGGAAEGTLRGTWKSTDGSQPLTLALVDSMLAGKMYVNLHTAASPSGEIRGKLVLMGGTGFVASMDSAQETPPTLSHGTGTGSVNINAAHTEISYNLTWLGLTGVLSAAGGHIHAGSPGRAGSVVHPIVGGGDSASKTISGTWKVTDASQPLTPALIESLLTGRLYFNVHTVANTGGEIRGQIVPTTGIGFTAQLDGAQAGNATTGTGTASIVLNPEHTALQYRLTFFGLSGTLSGAGGHFHVGSPGTNGPVVKAVTAGGGAAQQTITGRWSTTDTTQALTSALVDSLVHGKIYVNFHTTAFPSGELRGAVNYDGGVVVTGVSEGPVNEVPVSMSLAQNYPNPFNPTTAISYQLSAVSKTKIAVYDLLGREVAVLVNDVQNPGSYRVVFDARGLSSGVYYYRLSAGNQSVTKKMALVR